MNIIVSKTGLTPFTKESTPEWCAVGVKDRQVYLRSFIGVLSSMSTGIRVLGHNVRLTVCVEYVIVSTSVKVPLMTCEVMDFPIIVCNTLVEEGVV